MTMTKRQRHDNMRAQMDNEYSSFSSHYRELSEYISPRRSRFMTSDVNKGDRRNTKIIDSTATMAARTLRSGMMSGLTSPARQWFRLTTPDPDLAEFGAVKEWLHQTSQRMGTLYLKSNIYNTLPIVYGDTGIFGTAAMSLEEDFNSVIHTQSFPVGSYRIAKDFRGRVNTFFREFRMTVAQLVEMFAVYDKDGKPDWAMFSETVKENYEKGNYGTWIDVCHMVGPNPDYNPKRPQSKFKKFESCYYEKSGAYGRDGKEKYLRERGYDFFPILAPRWEVTGEDTYGSDCPGMAALGDIKQLQLGEKRIAQAIEKMINPPMIAPTSLMNQKTSILPGDLTFSDDANGSRGFRPAHEVNPRVMELEQKQEQVRNRIQRAFYEDLFLMLANSDRRQITAREIDERHEEKLLALGPVLEQLNQDLLDPLIDNTFDIMVRQGQISEPPKELQGVQLKVEYVSVMAQAQKLLGISGVQNFMGFVGQVAQMNPGALAKINFDQALDIYGEMTSVPPSLIYTDEHVAGIREQQAQAQAQQMQMQQVRDVSASAKDLSQADLGGDNALSQIMKLTGG